MARPDARPDYRRHQVGSVSASPSGPGPAQVVVDVAPVVGICGTVSSFSPGLPIEHGVALPAVPRGHEWCGTVSAAWRRPTTLDLRARKLGRPMLAAGRSAAARPGFIMFAPTEARSGITALAGCPRREALRFHLGSLYRPTRSVDSAPEPSCSQAATRARGAAAQREPGRKVLVWGPGSIVLARGGVRRVPRADVDVALPRLRREGTAKSFPRPRTTDDR